MKAVIISIKPKWCEKVANGQKTIEVRKTRPKMDTPFKCYIYCTQGGDWLVSINGKVNKPNSAIIDLTANTIIHELNGKVIGHFVCDRIEPFDVPYPAWSREYLNPILNGACLTYSDLHSYIGSGNRGYGWHIRDLVIYEQPKELSEFFTPIGKRPSYMLERPPQSWCYVEEKEKER